MSNVKRDATPALIESRLQPRSTIALSLVVLLSAAAILFFAGLGRLPLVEPDEGRNAEVAREMLATGDWITPHYDTFVYLDKPAVFFWLVAASEKIFGVSEFAARLPSACMAVATMLLVGFLARRMFGHAAGLCAAFAFAVSPLTIALARQVIFDMTLTFLVTIAMAAFWLAEENNFQALGFHLLMFAAMGLAIITKGFVGILLPLIATLIYEAACGQWRQWLRLRWGPGLLVLFAVALPWFIAVSVRNPAFPRYAFWNESLQRFATGASHRAGGVVYYIPVFLGGFFPWSLFLLMAGWNRLRRWKQLREESARPILFLLCWAAWVFVFFTVSHSKLPAYFLPAIVPLSILIGAIWREATSNQTKRPPDWLTAGFALLLGLGVLVAAASHSWVFAGYQGKLAKKLQPHVLALIQPSLLYTGLIVAAWGFLGRRLAGHVRGRAVITFALAALLVPMLVLRWYAPLNLLAEANSSRRLAATISASPQRDSPIYGYYYFRTSLPFYLRRPVGLLSIHWGELTSNYQVTYQAAGRRVPGNNPGKGLLITPDQFTDIAKSNVQPTLVLTPNRLVESVWHAAGRIEPLWNEFEFSIWEIPPAGGSPNTTLPVRIVPPFPP